jgi:hypothetical protein
MSEKKIAIKCEGSGVADLEDLTEFQGTLKKLSAKNRDKLRRSILKYGFTTPIFIWSHHGKKDCLDGHQRIKVLRDLQNEGYKIPKLPIVTIQAKNREEAKEKLLHISSQYGEVNKSGLDLYLEDIEADDILETIRIPKGELTIEEHGDNGGEPEVEFTEELLEEHNFIVLYFDNEIDWLQAKTLFGLKTVQALDSKKGFRKMGIGRVVNGADAIKRLNGEG